MSQYPATAAGAYPATAGAGAYNATTTGFATETHAAAPMPAAQTRGSSGKVHTSAKPAALLPLLLLALAGWAVYVGGLAALQHQCDDYEVGEVVPGDVFGNTAYLNGVSGFSSAVLPCSKVYRWSWFCMAFELVSILGLLIATVMGRLWHARLAFLAMFAVCTLLFMLQTERFLTVTSVNVVSPGYEGGVWEDRAWCTFAGCIILVVSNILIILAIGIDRLVDHTGQSAEGYGHGHGTKV